MKGFTYSPIITLTGLTTTMFQIGYRDGLIIVEDAQWCAAHNKPCYRSMVGRAMPGPPFGEITFHNLNGPDIIP